MQPQKSKKKYDTDVTDKEWEMIAALIPPAKQGGRPRTIDVREAINAVFYINKSGCQWRLLPNDFPKWKSVYNYFRAWKHDGTWKRIHDTLRAKVRASVKKKGASKFGNHR